MITNETTKGDDSEYSIWRKHTNNQRIAVLGPAGTCTDAVTQTYKHPGDIVEYAPTYEVAVGRIKIGTADVAIVPAAYPGLNDLIFRNQGRIGIIDSFLHPTPEFVVASRQGNSLSMPELDVACHPAPRALCEILPRMFPSKRFNIIDSGSNSLAARMVAESAVDICVTNIIAARLHNLVVVHNFGPVMMAWLVLGQDS